MSSEKTDVDELLLKLIARGDETSLEMLYERHSRTVYSLALHILRDLPDAEEVTQEIFLKYWNNAVRFDRSKGTAFAWLMAVARRHAIDRTRSRRYKSKQREESFEATNSFQNLVDDREDAKSTLDRSENEKLVSDALSEIPQEHRRVVELAFFSGLSHSKIAAQLEMPLGSVKTNIRQAMSELRSILGGIL